MSLLDKTRYIDKAKFADISQYLQLINNNINS